MGEGTGREREREKEFVYIYIYIYIYIYMCVKYIHFINLNLFLKCCLDKDKDMLKYIAVVIIAYYCYDFYTNHTHKDVMVLLKGNKDVDANAIKILRHTHSVYKVKYFAIVNGTKWNYAVLANGFLTDDSRNAYVSALKYFTFVESAQELNIYADPAIKVIFMNALMKISKFIGNIFGYLPRRPLNPEIPPIINCSTVDIGMDEPMFAMSFFRDGNTTALSEYGRAIMLYIFPVLNVEMVYTGSPHSERWSQFNIQRYDGRKTFCEYVESELVIKYGALYLKAFAEMNAYTAAEI